MYFVYLDKALTIVITEKSTCTIALVQVDKCAYVKIFVEVLGRSLLLFFTLSYIWVLRVVSMPSCLDLFLASLHVSSLLNSLDVAIDDASQGRPGSYTNWYSRANDNYIFLWRYTQYTA